MARLGCGGNLCVHSGLSPYMVHSLFITHWPGWDTLALDVTLVQFFNCVAAKFNQDIWCKTKKNGAVLYCEDRILYCADKCSFINCTMIL